MGSSRLNGLVIAGILVFLLGVAGLAIPVFTTQGDIKMSPNLAT